MIAFILEILFLGFCGWLGHVAVKAISLGKIHLDYGSSSESVITAWIGVGVLLAVAMLISFLINAKRDQSLGTRADTQPILMVQQGQEESLIRGLAMNPATNHMLFRVLFVFHGSETQGRPDSPARATI